MTSRAVAESLEMTVRPVPPTSAGMERADSPESSDSASIGTPKLEATQSNARSIRDELLPSNRENKDSNPSQAPMHTQHPLKKHVLYSIIIVAAIGFASLISVCYLIAYIRTKSKNEHPYITAEIVGGRFSSTAAKLIDAAFSMLVAPAIVAIANWHMFKLARLSAVNEHPGRSSAVSMKVLVEVANTDWGSFSPLKFWTFARSKRPRVICLGVIAMISALSFALLSNVVAYQAGVMLEYFHLQPLAFESAADGLLRVNVSARSQNGLPRDVKKLFDAPVYRLNLSCATSAPRAVTIEQPDDQDLHVRITFEDTSALGSEMIQYQANFGRDESILSRKSLDDADDKYPGIRYPLVAFNQTSIWIGGIDVNQSVGIGLANGSYHLALSGVNCHLEKSSGHADIKVNGDDWIIIKDTLFNEHRDPRPDEPMSRLTSTLEIFDDGRIGRAPGLGGHLLRAALNTTSEGYHPSWRLQSLFEAFLWYETASRQTLLDNSPAARTGWYQIQCDTDKYAMTFIPWILLIGLIALGVACAITVGLSIDSRKVHSLRIGRSLDSIRLTADVGVAVDKQVLEECSTWHGSRLNKCADGARFQYEADTRLDSDTGLYSIGIRLRQISRPHE
ncbi:hypothetical protein FPSE_04497 [Fusarium pseudograminearum CS3096]|uniref:Uncharacterized protein n=1 Tax=Fusarium pseudograminearum (strain CS3096) TaxID=1028729 RepID=K3VNM3_FUSPC|nr:hypothetical protein FPSE_04497 [Fusarium pseudograminearum CS3096]EKJ75308.1 hypothetical protein FPSE_04497 [Fusarium pseudograminearum CS3096]